MYHLGCTVVKIFIFWNQWFSLYTVTLRARVYGKTSLTWMLPLFHTFYKNEGCNLSAYNNKNTFVTQFSVPQIEYPLGGSSKKGSHIYFLLIVAMVLLLWHQIVLLWHQVTMIDSIRTTYQTIVQFDKIKVLPRKHATGSMHDYLFFYCP